MLDRLRRALATVSGASFRLYRTAAGYRVLGTDRLYGPADPATVQLMKATGTDSAFITLCRVQDCFRARLTPKPWRIGQPRPSLSFPYLNPAAAAAAASWQGRYESACSAWATCRFLESLGAGAVHAQVAPVLTFHDVATRSESRLPLA